MDKKKVFLFISSLLNVAWSALPVNNGEDGILLYGKYSDELISGHLVIPRKVNQTGELITHNLTHHHHEDTKDLHYRIELNNDTFHLELEPHTYFMAPAIVVERHRRDLRSRRKPSKNTNCHYHGKIRGHPNSRVALSACDGLVGHIRTKNAEYFIEPSKHHDPSNDGHPHVVFHRTAIKEKKNKKNRHHKNGKKKQQYNHSLSNCGTKEPRRRTETRIEWQPQGKVIVQGGRKIRRHNHPHHGYSNRTTRSHQQQSHQPVSQRKRSKRSISSPRHVEAMLVADSTMVDFHGDVEAYLLTIMNMVSALYKDPTIGNAIEIVVVKIVLIEDEEAHPEMNLNENAQRNLDVFCTWQHKQTSSEKNPQRHDVAILITRKNICGSNCMTLGLANVGGMCKPRKSCSVNEDNGIMLSHTIAHELGHNFGMYHDTMKIGCHGRVGPIVHIMTPTFGADTLQVSWSNCSRKYITHFLDQGLGKCLDNEPIKSTYPYPELPPGAMYNAELQCRLQFNLTDLDDVHVCSSTNEICSQLWCQVQGECVTNMRPAAPGTTCGKHKWCQNGQCVPMEEISPLDGGWGNWSDWSECSRTCGGGVSIQQRECNNPIPANGGLFCIGERKRYTICNKDLCPEGEPSFRAQQCSAFDNVPYQGETYKWLPYFDKYSPCKLLCTDKEDTVIANWGDIVADGTPCEIGTKNMCIDGICKKVGCDWIVNSDKEEDRCGICGGDDTNCEPVKEIFEDDFNTTDGYVPIVTIPARSRHIIIKEMGNSPHFLSIGKTNDSKFYLNGERLISMPGEFIIAGAESMYDREDDKETIKIPKAIEHSITLYVIVRGETENEGIYYEFTLPVVNQTSVQNYTWKLGDWTACTATCGGGTQNRMPLCFQGEKLVIDDDELCWSNAVDSRPKQQVRKCNEIPCPAHWWIGPWQLCPVTCKIEGASNPVKRRSIMCLDQNEVVLPDARCNNGTRPIDVESCGENLPECSSDMKNDIILD